MKIMIEGHLFDNVSFGEIPENVKTVEPGDIVEILLDGLPRKNYIQNWKVSEIYFIGLSDSDAYGVDLENNPYMFTNLDVKVVKKKEKQNGNAILQLL
jgi:hypothetical protein